MPPSGLEWLDPHATKVQGLLKPPWSAAATTMTATEEGAVEKGLELRKVSLILYTDRESATMHNTMYTNCHTGLVSVECETCLLFFCIITYVRS